MRRTLSLCGAIVAAAIVLAVVAAGATAARAGFCQGLRGELVHGGGGASGLMVIEAESGDVVCRRAAKVRRPLASNMKIFTTATALGRFGAETRIPTRLLASGNVDEEGVLHGNLYLQGGGDPTLGAPAFLSRYLGGFGTNLYLLKSQLRAAGVSEVTGHLYADDTIFDRLRGVADSSYATSPYIGPLSGLAFDLGYNSLSATSFASDPATLAAAKLAHAMQAAGIEISSRVALAPAPAGAEVLGVLRSPTIAQIAQATNVPSNNFFAETLIKLIGAQFGGAGSTRAGAAVVDQFAREHESGVHAVDGSGLTRSGRASPAQVVRFLRSVRNAPFGEDFIQSLALAGREGTVADRMHGTAASGRCRTKTGTLTGVSNLSGYCFNRNGKVMIFSVMMAGVRDLSLAHAEQDAIAGAVAAR